VSAYLYALSSYLLTILMTRLLTGSTNILPPVSIVTAISSIVSDLFVHLTSTCAPFLECAIFGGLEKYSQTPPRVCHYSMNTAAKLGYFKQLSLLLQRATDVSIPCYAERCTSYSLSVRPSVRLYSLAVQHLLCSVNCTIS